MSLDREVIIKLRDYFKNHTDETKRKSLFIALDWLDHFVDFFRQDYLQLLEENKELDQQSQEILRQVYTQIIPDLISIIMRLKNSSKIDPRTTQVVEKLNKRLLETVLQIFLTKDQYEFIFTRLKKEFKGPKNNSQTYEAIIHWYT